MLNVAIVYCHAECPHAGTCYSECRYGDCRAAPCVVALAYAPSYIKLRLDTSSLDKDSLMRFIDCNALKGCM
jgi:hypothetical protein